MARDIKTIERYVSLYIRIQATDNQISDVAKWNFNDFKKETGLQSESQFRLARSLARNTDIQKDVNNYFSERKISSRVIKPIQEKSYIPKRVEIKPTPAVEPSFTRFTKDSQKFDTIKGKRFEIATTPENFKKDAKSLLRVANDKAQRETQKFDAKQIKVNVKGVMKTNKRIPDKQLTLKSFQTKARVDKRDLVIDLAGLVNTIETFVGNYNPEGSIEISVSVVNYTI